MCSTAGSTPRWSPSRTVGDDADELRELVARHHAFTDSAVAAACWRWDEAVDEFVKVMPNDYKRVLTVMREAEAEGLGEAEVLQRVMEASWVR